MVTNAALLKVLHDFAVQVVLTTCLIIQVPCSTQSRQNSRLRRRQTCHSPESAVAHHHLVCGLVSSRDLLPMFLHCAYRPQRHDTAVCIAIMLAQVPICASLLVCKTRQRLPHVTFSIVRLVSSSRRRRDMRTVEGVTLSFL